MVEDWMTNGYPDPDVYREQLRRRIVKFRRLARISAAARFRKKPYAPYYGVRQEDVWALEREYEGMTANTVLQEKP